MKYGIIYKINYLITNGIVTMPYTNKIPLNFHPKKTREVVSQIQGDSISDIKNQYNDFLLENNYAVKDYELFIE